MKYVLGIDQGSTHTRAAVCNEKGNLLSCCQTYGACHSVHGLEMAMMAVKEASEAAIEQAGVQKKELAVLFGGFTGADWPDEYSWLRSNLLSLNIAEQVFVVNDCIVALRGGTEASYGVIVVAGTGGNCAIRSPKEEEFVYHYYQDADLQGGVALGKRTLSAIYKAATGRKPETRLTSVVLEMFNLQSVDDLLRRDVEKRLQADKIKEIAPFLMRLAYEGDVVSCEIVKAFGEGLAELVTAGVKRFGMEGEAFEVVTSGSIFKGPGSLLQDVMLSNIQMTAPRANLVNARYEPVVGAVLLGLEKIGVSIDQGIKDRIEASSREHDLIRT